MLGEDLDNEYTLKIQQEILDYLPARYVIHTVGPIWGQGDEEKLLCMVRKQCHVLPSMYGKNCLSCH